MKINNKKLDSFCFYNKKTPINTEFKMIYLNLYFKKKLYPKLTAPTE